MRGVCLLTFLLDKMYEWKALALVRLRYMIFVFAKFLTNKLCYFFTYINQGVCMYLLSFEMTKSYKLYISGHAEKLNKSTSSGRVWPCMLLLNACVFATF